MTVFVRSVILLRKNLGDSTQIRSGCSNCSQTNSNENDRPEGRSQDNEVVAGAGFGPIGSLLVLVEQVVPWRES
jgi:hypothetical protein